jgi:hypothetical protein
VLKDLILLFFLFIAACSSSDATVQNIGFEEPTREELKVAMRYHGVRFAEQDNNGEWYFYRDGQRCRLFAYQTSSN